MIEAEKTEKPDKTEKELLADIYKLLNKKDQYLPVSIDLWSVEIIAQYLKRDKTSVRDRIISLPDFPPAIRLPSGGPRGGYPLFKAKEVIEWVDKYRDKNQEKRLANS